MNPDQPSREQIETRITALLLGELPADEAALLRYTISQDPALKKLHDQLESALPLVREAAKHPAEALVEKPAPLKLSANRREQLLAHFKTPRPQATKEPLFWLKKIRVPSLIEVLVAVAIVAVLAAMLLPSLSKAKLKSQHVAMLGEMRQKALEDQVAAEERRDSLQSASATPQPSAPAPVAVAAPNNSPVAVTLGPEPQLAPPPATPPNVQIVLPQPESTPGVVAQSATQENTDTHGVYSQSTVGYVNVSPGGQTSTAAPAPATGTFALQSADSEAVRRQGLVAAGEKQWKVPSQAIEPSSSTGTPPGGAGISSEGWAFGGVGYGGTSPTEQPKKIAPPTTATLALDDSSGNRAISGYLPYTAEHGSPAAGAISQRAKEAPQVTTLSATPAALPWGAPPDGNENFFRLTNGLADSNPGPDSPFISRYAYVAPSPAPGTNIFAFDSGKIDTFNPGVSAITPTMNYNLTPQDKLGVAKSTSETLNLNEALQRYGELTGRSVLRDSLPEGGEISLPKSLSKEDETKALQAVLALNGVSVVNIGDKFVKLIPLDQAGSAGGDIARNPVATAPTLALDTTAQSLEAARQKDQDGVKKNGPYETALADLEQKRRMHELLYSKLEAEKIDWELPKSSMVQITEPAQPGKSQNTWQRLTGQVESTARVKVENDVTDTPGIAGAPNVAYGYDPYFIQTTFEIMQSEPVLGKVVDALNLQSAWAKNNGGEKLNRTQAVELLKQRLDLRLVKNTKLIAISAKSSDPQEAADIANAVAKAYAQYRIETRQALTTNGFAALEDQYAREAEDLRVAQEKVDRLRTEIEPSTSPSAPAESDLPIRKPTPDTPLPQPEILTSNNAFSTFSLNVSDVSFKLAEASLQNGKLPDTASIRSEEFINAFDYRDPEAAPGQPMAFTAERAHYPFAQNRDLLRFSIKTAAAGREANRPLNLVLLLDTSGSMERADRVEIVREALRVLAAQLRPNDIVSVVSFTRTARLWADGISGDKAGETLGKVGSITPEGGTNLEEAMRLAYETARRHYLANGLNRVVLLTDGAANLGNVDPNALKQKVDAQRQQGIALDCFGIGWEDFNDDLLEELSSNGDGRYAFLNSPEDAAKDFGTKLAGALQVAAQDVKVQVEFNPQRVISYRQIGYAKHQLTKEQFRDNTVAAGEIAAQEAGNALYTIETNPNGDGPVATVHVRYRIPGTQDYREHSWDVPYTGNAPALEKSSPAMRLAATASAFSEWLAASPYAQEVTPDELLRNLSGVPEVYGADDRPKQLETMIREAKSLEGK